MLRNPALAVVLFLGASCELAGAPPAQTAKPPTETPIVGLPPPNAEPTQAPGVSARAAPAAEPEAELFVEERFTGRAGPRWTKEKKARFKATKGGPIDLHSKTDSGVPVAPVAVETKDETADKAAP